MQQYLATTRNSNVIFLEAIHEKLQFIKLQATTVAMNVVSSAIPVKTLESVSREFCDKCSINQVLYPREFR